uniref:Ig-like domain-containing protein n=1 Tax=Branchiostoma floridae TaxID=7739 RepID=C3ZLE0_BRAFL|eukprot:XP_002590566.1 hypothetical protein BRAFLDRAFT_83799 [Branchiostoma floridae]
MPSVNASSCLHNVTCAVISKPQPTSVLLGGSATLSCGFDGLKENEAVHWLGPPNLHYISEGTSVSGKYPRMFITGKGNSGDTTGVYNLNIRDVRPEDEGVYRCSTFSLKDPEDVKLTVIDPPSIQKTFDEKVNVLYDSEEEFFLECKADGNPTPRVRWRRKNTDLYFNNPLRFSRLDYQTEGTYECVADSLAFTESVKEAVIDVIVFITTQGRPDIRGDPETAHATQGSSVTLLCEVTSDPPPDSIIWSWRNSEGREITLTGGSVDGLTIKGKTTDDFTESLMILDHVSSASSGDYICKATNMFGSDTREFRVIVTGQ